MALLEVDELHVGYGFPVLLGIGFAVEEGETAVLFGLNGAGKTTTVATIAGLLKPDSGTIRFDGEDIAGRSPTQLVDRGIALVPEGRRHDVECGNPRRYASSLTARFRPA